MQTELTHENLTAIEDIKRLKARYFRAMDTRDWVVYGETFAPDASLSVDSLQRGPNGDPVLSRLETGRDTIVTWVSGVLDQATTIHHGHMPEIDILAADRARGIWAMVDRVIWPDRWLRGWGHYHETYRRIEGRWHIATSRLTRLHVEMSSAAAAGAPQMLDQITQAQ